MPKFAPVAPIQILEAMNPKLLGNYQLFLAHHTVEHPDRFHNLLSNWHNRHVIYDPMQIIMDNSIVELGGAVDDDMIFEATKICSLPYACVVPCLPDVMGSAAQTLELSLAAYDRWEMMSMNSLSHQGYMIVTQGETWEEFTALVDWVFRFRAHKYPNIRWVGVPRYMLKQWANSRHDAIQYIRMIAPHLKIHLLGFSQDIFDDMRCARMEGVSGIDSAVPVRYHGVLTPSTSEEEIGPRGDWWGMGELNPLAIDNIQAVRSWIR